MTFAYGMMEYFPYDSFPSFLETIDEYLRLDKWFMHDDIGIML